MTSVVICDVCNHPVASGDSVQRLAVLSDGNSHKKVYDMHIKCYRAMQNWMSNSREQSAKFKTFEQIRTDK